MTIDTESSRETCGYESCRDDNTSAAKNFGDISSDTNVSWTFSLDCKHLLPCGKCSLSDEECKEHANRPTYPTYPVYPNIPDYPRPYKPWQPHAPWESDTIIFTSTSYVPGVD